MSLLRNLGQETAQSKGPWERRLLLWIVGVVIGSAVVIVAAYYFDVVTESDEFCGTCHAIRPQYVAQQVSPHSELECGTCHIGPGLLPKVTAKIYGLKELYLQVTNTYERPIAPPLPESRIPDDMCQQCHWSDQFYSSQVLDFARYASDEANSQTDTYLALRLGRGGIPEDTAQGVHWHIENLSYIARDILRQDIPWIGVERNGELVEYQATDNPLTPEEMERLPRQQMSCLDCHNRATHSFAKPERSLDKAMAAGRIDPDLPFVKREALDLLSASYPTQEAGLEAMENLGEFYRSEYPAIYADKQPAVEEAISELRYIYRYSTFPEMKLTWDVYPDNAQHTDSLGCFRCHDGRHLNAEGAAIPLNCSLCHSVPLVVKADSVPDLDYLYNFVARAEREPDFHRESEWIREHRIRADDSCAECHGPIEYGTDDSSYCANSACHARNWLGVDMDLGFTHPVELEDKHAQATCNECHQGVLPSSIEDCSACHRPDPEPHFGTECTQCHTTEGWKESAINWVTDVPSNPHGVVTVDCLSCHGPSGVKPAPDTHQEISSESCVYCHKSVSIVAVPTIPHPVEEPDNCLTCHGDGELRPASAIHEGVPAESCVSCHESMPVEAVSTIPHVIEGRGRCLACHGDGELKPVPANHERWSNEFCLLCHEPGVAE